MRIGIHLPQIGRKAGPEAIRRAAVQAEELGFADAWTSEHIIVPADAAYPPSPVFWDPVLCLTWAAAFTSRIGLGTSVLVLPMRHPVPLAKELATLQNLSGGRFILGAGVGWMAAEFAALGAPFHERGRRMDEGIALMRSVWRDDPVSFPARYIPAVIDDMRMLPKPEKPIPIWIGGSSEAALRRALRQDGWHGSRLAPEQVAPIVRRLREARPEPEFAISLRHGWDGTDRGALAARLAQYAAAGVGHVLIEPAERALDAWLAAVERVAEGDRPVAGGRLTPVNPFCAGVRPPFSRVLRAAPGKEDTSSRSLPPTRTPPGAAFRCRPSGHCSRRRKFSLYARTDWQIGPGFGEPLMKLAIALRVSPTSGIDIETVREAERLGFAAVWCGEAYGTDAVSPVAWVLAQTTRIKAGTSIMQMPARTPACAAMTAMTLQLLSDNRFLCGIGPSGPQVVEGWHGVPFGKPLLRTREYITVIRRILEREAPLEFRGQQYRIPYDGPDATGLGKPLKSIIHGDPSLKIYTASIAPAGLRLAGEVADGTLPFFMSPEQADAITGPVADGIAKAEHGKTLADFDLAPYVRIAVGNDLAVCRDTIRPNFALYIGGMGARARNFYNDLARRMGYGEAAAAIQEHYLAGRRREAEAAVPDALIDETSLIGPKERIRDRLQAWQELARDHRVGSLVLAGATREAMRIVAEAFL
jgi:F420-dependent oxidoreductase-like protein